MATYVKLSHNGTINTIALLEGLNAEELNDLLQTVFNVSGKIVGLMANKGLVLPLTLVAKNPQIIPTNSVCKILISSSTASTSTLPSTTTTSLLSNNPSNASLPTKNESIQEKIRAVSEDNDDDDDSVEYVTQDIIRFINGLKSQKFITNKQFDLLIDLLSENSSLLFAGYSVAVSANDSEYFAEICKDIANSLVTENGRASCEVQDEILQLCDQLYINGNVTENQLLYLRHLTLIRDESVATLYDEYQEHQSVPLLAKALYILANTHPYQTSEKSVSVSEPNSETVEDEEDDDDEEETDDNQGSDYPESDSQSQQKRDDIATIQKGLIGVISLMTRSFVITKTEASILLDMVDQENEYVLAAYELYERNRNLDDLQDTLLRCVKLEVRKRVTDIQEKELGSLTQESQTNFTSSLDEDDNRNGYTEDDEGDEDDDEEEDGNDDEQEDSVSKQDDESDNFSLEDITLESILISLGVQNIWKETVPENFLHTVFIAVVRRQLDLDQAKAVCDLFHAKYDNVLSAWEVYTVQQDANDFIDTLRRIVRDINGQDVKPAATSSASNTPAPKSPPKETTASRTSPTKQSPSTTASSPNKSAEQELTDRKNEAMKAVSAAKKELLKHSLEMMVKQGITTAKKASDLYGRYLANDPLVDAAIEAYASDRDVSEFLDTLQILANHSQEELDTLMSMAKDEEENNEPEKETPAPQPTKSNQTTSATSASTSSTDSSSTDINPSDVDEIALLQVADIVNEMLKNDMIGPSVAEQFYNLIQARDQRLIDAYNTYLQTKSGATLVDSLLRIVIASVEEMQKKVPSSSSSSSASPARNNTSSTTQTKPTASPTKQSTPEKQSTPQSSQTSTKEPSPNSKQALLDHEDQKTVVDILVRAQAITKEQQTTLYRMVEQNDPIVASIFVKYETDKNVYGLIDSLKSLVLFDQEMGGDDDDDDEEDEEEAPEDEVEPEEENEVNQQPTQTGELEDDDEEEDDDENFNEDDRDIIEHKFLEIIQKMNLNELETAALRLAIAENDPKVRAGIDSFRESQNEQLLMMSLKSAAQDVIMRILSNKSSSSNDEEDDDEEEENKRDEDEEDDDDDIEERLKDLNEEFNPYSSRSYLSDSKYQDDLEDNEQRAPEDDEDMQEDSEDYNDQQEDDDDEDENEQSTSLLTSQAARDHVFPILVDELVKENILSNKHGKVILQEFAANNPVIGAALDIYDIDNDMAQLVESLQELADNLTRNYD